MVVEGELLFTKQWEFLFAAEQLLIERAELLCLPLTKGSRVKSLRLSGCTSNTVLLLNNRKYFILGMGSLYVEQRCSTYRSLPQR
jgi:hypothetical protein